MARENIQCFSQMVADVVMVKSMKMPFPKKIYGAVPDTARVWSILSSFLQDRV